MPSCKPIFHSKMNLSTLKNIAYFLIMTCGGALFSSNSIAQQVYRSVGADGRVTFSDQPPAPSSNAKITIGRGGVASGDEGAGLPFELRTVALRFPVTIYTTAKDCSGCDAGRSMLKARGIPFNERLIESQADTEAMTRQFGGVTIPLLTIGSQQLKGYSDAEWSQYLDAAGYPKTSQLPANYRAPAATPLTPRAAAPDTASSAPAARQTGTVVRTAPPAANNPAGIRF
jgi:glutaredoxin